MTRLFLGAIAALTVLTLACGDDQVTNVIPGEYREPTSPENVLWNLAEAYRHRNIEEYAKLLATEFFFKFQPADRVLIEDDFWTKDQDSTGTSNLFRAPVVSEIRITLIHGAPEDPQEPGFEPGVKLVRVNPTFLEVDQRDGVTWQVDGDIQDFFLRPGKEAVGENSDRWFIIEWRDVPSPVSAPRTGAVEGVTWGRMKTAY